MGILYSVAEFLIHSRQRGVEFGECLTLGRQNLFVSPIELVRMLRAASLWPAGASEEAFYRDLYGSPMYGEGLLRILGAANVRAMDYSAYEGAHIVHDLNQPIPDSLKGQFDSVLDLGTLEHVFNFPIAVRNAMEMLKVGGHFISVTPVNNFFGHGFYQFGAELFYRVFSEPNGFAVESMRLCENEVFASGLLGRPIPIEKRGRWYDVADPDTVRQRVMLVSRYPVYMFTLARRTREAAIFQQTPLQSDYSATWNASAAPSGEPAAAAPPPAGTVAPPPTEAGYSPRWLKQKHLQLHVLPRLLRWLDPFLLRRGLRGRSLKRGVGFVRVK